MLRSSRSRRPLLHGITAALLGILLVAAASDAEAACGCGGGVPVFKSAKLRGNDLTLTAENQGEFTGRVNGTTIEGTQRPAGGGAPQALTLTRVN